MPILDITPLGSARSGTAGAVAAIVDYLTRNAHSPAPGIDGPVGYYADRAERPGIWRGRGVGGEQHQGGATAYQLTNLLNGAHPDTGTVLIASTGSSGRAARDRDVPPATAQSDTLLDVTAAAARLGVDLSYVKRLLLATERHTQDPEHHRAPIQPLHGERDGAGRWRVEPSEIQRFISARSEPKVVVAYDATFKWEKSITAAWVQADPATRQVIEDALDLGVRTGIAYLEDHGLEVRSRDRRVAADGMWAVQYRHTSNRNLEPQLHDHVVIANIAADPDGDTRTIAARSLFTHATTAGHLAGQAVRHHLTAQLGYQWGPVRNGTCDIVGVHPTALAAISTRSTEVRELAEAYGATSQQARRVAALATRKHKQEPADPTTLEAGWRDTLSYWGFTADHERDLHGHARTVAFRDNDSTKLHAHLDSPEGVTKASAIFDRNEVVRAVIAWDGQHGGAARLTAEQVEHEVTRWLASEAAVRLDRHETRTPRYTTASMLRIETDVLDAYRNGVGALHDSPDSTVIRAEQTLWQRTTGRTLGRDQAAFVQQLAGSTDRFALGVGPAGTGKTASLSVACRAWEAAGYQPLGVTVTGAAADVLAEACGIDARTVASLVTELTAGHNPLRPHTVLIVDEASTLSNRDHHQLVQAVTAAGARMRAIGDPAQHGAVDAGGLWTQLLHTQPDRVAQLQENRRQPSASMSDVRRAGELLRTGKGRDAIMLLADTDRLATAATAADLVADIVHDWHIDHGRHLTDGTAPSRMMAEHHSTRRLLNRAAQDHLRADGTIKGPGVRVGDELIHQGDEIITRTQNRDIRARNGRSLRNGVVGTVTQIDPNGGDPRINVKFPGFGIQTLHGAWLHQEIRPGVTGAIAPAYAITTHVAQGQTMDAGRAVVTDTTAPEAAYVALTRGRHDARLYVLDSPVRIERRSAADAAEFPILLDEPELLEAVAQRLQRKTATETATSISPDAPAVHRLSLQPIKQILQSTRHRDDALAMALDRAQLRSLLAPPAAYLADYGPRPEADDPQRPAWDRIVATRARSEAVHGPWTGTPRDQRLSQLHNDAKAARLDRLELRDVLVSIHDQSITLTERLELEATITRRIQRAVAEPADYLTTILGRPPDDSRRFRWDNDATDIERVRHRTGLRPTDGISGLDATGVLGREPRELTDSRRWQSAARVVTDALAEQLTPDAPEHDAPRRRGPSRRM